MAVLSSCHPKFSIQRLSYSLSQESTAIHAVPTMFEAIVSYQKSEKVHGSYSLRTGIIAGAALSGELLHRLNDNLGLSALLYAFGEPPHSYKACILS